MPFLSGASTCVHTSMCYDWPFVPSICHFTARAYHHPPIHGILRPVYSTTLCISLEVYWIRLRLLVHPTFTSLHSHKSTRLLTKHDNHHHAPTSSRHERTLARGPRQDGEAAGHPPQGIIILPRTGSCYIPLNNFESCCLSNV